MAENEGVGLLKGRKGPVAVFDDLADERFADAVGRSTNLGPFRHGQRST